MLSLKPSKKNSFKALLKLAKKTNALLKKTYALLKQACVLVKA